MIGPTKPTNRKNWLTSAVLIRSRIRIPDHFSTSVTIAEWGILGYLLAFLIYIRWPISTTLGEITDAHKINNPQHFGSDSADIPILINPEIRIRIPDHFQLRSDALAEVCALWRQSSFLMLRSAAVADAASSSSAVSVVCRTSKMSGTQGIIYTADKWGVEPPKFSRHPTKIIPPIGGVQALQVQPCYCQSKCTWLAGSRYLFTE